MLWEDAGWHNWVPASAPLQGFYRVRALRGHQVTKFIRWQCLQSTFLLLLTCSEKMPGQKIDSLGVPTFHVSTALCTRWEDTGQQSWFPGSAHVHFLLRFACFQRMLGNKIDSLGVPTFNVSLAFHTFWKDAGNKVASLGVPTLNVSIVFYKLWEDAGSQNWFRRSAHMQCFYCVLHALRRCQVTKLIPWESQFLLCFTHFESMLVNRTDSLEVPTLYFYSVSHALRGCWVTQLIS